MHDEANDTTGEAESRPFSDGRILVVAMKGWNDAGEAASSAVTTLAASLRLSHRVAIVDDEEFFDYSINRPHSVRSRSGKRRIVWPHMTLLSPAGEGEELDIDPEGMDADELSARLDEAGDAIDRGDGEAGDADGLADRADGGRGADEFEDSDEVSVPGEVPLFSASEASGDPSDGDEPDAEVASGDQGSRGATGNLASDAEMRVTGANGANLMVLFGHEPTLHWRGFMNRILDLCEEHGVDRIVLVGALLADVPHSRPINVFVSSEHRPFRDELDIGRSEYQGPTGVLGALGDFASQRDIPSVSLWASVPHYASQPPSPKAELAVIDKLEELLDVTIPRAKLIERAEQWEDEVDAATGDDNEI
ncbi:MAG: proteasome assembly chaperone family protein, partial [Pseudoclavibacter sp.]